MIKINILIGLLFVSLSACTANHYVEKQLDLLTLYLQVPDATRIQFASSVDNFLLHEASQDRSGIWEVTLPAGSEFAYFYIVDGAPYLPECRFKETDDFGSENCLYLP